MRSKPIIYSLGGSTLFVLLGLGGGGEIFLRDRRHETVHLVFVTDWTMLKSIRAIDAHSSVDCT